MGNVTVTSRFPPFAIAMSESETGVAISGNVPVNINEDVGTAGVIDVQTFRTGVIDVKVAEGFRIVSGNWIIDPNNHYSGQGTPNGYILKQIGYQFGILNDREGVFIISAGALSTEPGNPPINQVNGTVNATLKVVYVAV